MRRLLLGRDEQSILRLLNVEGNRRAGIATVGKERGMNVLGLNEALITREEVQMSLKEIRTVSM